jgi:hypothetical protein
VVGIGVTESAVCLDAVSVTSALQGPEQILATGKSRDSKRSYIIRVDPLLKWHSLEERWSSEYSPQTDSRPVNRLSLIVSNSASNRAARSQYNVFQQLGVSNLRGWTNDYGVRKAEWRLLAEGILYKPSFGC